MRSFVWMRQLCFATPGPGCWAHGWPTPDVERRIDRNLSDSPVSRKPAHPSARLKSGFPSNQLQMIRNSAASSPVLADCRTRTNFESSSDHLQQPLHFGISDPLSDFPSFNRAMSSSHCIAGQCDMGGPGVPSDHSPVKTKKVVTRCSGSYAAITGEPGRFAPQLFSASPEA